MDISKEIKIREIKQEIQKLYQRKGDINEIDKKTSQLFEILHFIDSDSKELTAWEKVLIARNKQRPTAKHYIEALFDDFTQLSGDRLYGDDKSIIGGIAKINKQVVTVIAQEKGSSTEEKVVHNFGMPHPEGYRKVMRLAKQAEKFRRPIIMIVDTPGAYPGIEAEERGQGEAIAKLLMDLSRLKTPIITIIIGEGGSGGALAMAISDYIYMLEYAIYSILSPEGYASIVYKDASKAKDICEDMKITATDLLKLSIIDEIVFEPTGGIHENPQFVYEELKTVIEGKIEELRKVSGPSLISNRNKKYRNF